jgi:hypothetical protein
MTFLAWLTGYSTVSSFRFDRGCLGSNEVSPQSPGFPGASYARPRPPLRRRERTWDYSPCCSLLGPLVVGRPPLRMRAPPVNPRSRWPKRKSVTKRPVCARPHAARGLAGPIQAGSIGRGRSRSPRAAPAAKAAPPPGGGSRGPPDSGGPQEGGKQDVFTWEEIGRLPLTVRHSGVGGRVVLGDLIVERPDRVPHRERDEQCAQAHRQACLAATSTGFRAEDV